MTAPASTAIRSGQVAWRARWALFDATVLGPLRLVPGRTALAVVAIALGVALGFAVHLINRVAADEVLKLIDEDEDIAVLVLAAGVGKEGPGPLVTALAGAGSATFPIPITIVPGNLSDEELDALS